MNFKLFSIIILISILFVCCLGEKSKTPIGRVVLKRDSTSQPQEACENLTITKYVCPDNEVVNEREECKVITPTPPTLAPTTTLLKTSSNLISVRRCLSGRCVEVKIPQEFDFLANQCEEDEECYSWICYYQTTTSTISTTTTTKEPCEEECEELGCPPGTKFVGSRKTDNYYCCASKCAEKILDKYLVCLMDEDEAILRGFKKPPYIFCK